MISAAVCNSLKFGLYAPEIEKRFCKVYGNVISSYFEFSEDLISDAKEILNSKKERKKFKTELPSYQLAFLLSFGVQDTCLSARKFYESIMNDPKIMKKLSGSNPIKLLCLESESLPTVIGICQVINEIVKEFGTGGKFDFTEIQISVIDNRGKWKRLCGYVIDTANSYFTNIEVKLDYVEDFLSWSIKEFNERIQGLDILIVARFFSEDRIFNYNLIRTVLNEMKEDAILFYFDTCNEWFYASLQEISKAHSFSQVMNCQNLLASFEDLGDEHYYLDLPISWDKDFQPVMFSTWIKNFPVQDDILPEVVKPIAFKELNSIESNGKSTGKKKVKTSSKQSNKSDAVSGQANIVIGKKKVKSSSKKSNESDIVSGQTNIVTGKKKVKSSCKQSNKSDAVSGQANIVIGKKKVESSSKKRNESDNVSGQTNIVTGKKNVKSSVSECNEPDALSGQTNIITGKVKINDLTKQCSEFDTHKKQVREVEKRFCEAYGYVIWNFFDFKEDLISGAKEMLNSKEERKKFNSDLPSYQLAFLLSFSVQDTCLSARKFFESIMNDPKIMRKLSQSKQIKLLCLESESLPTVIGICQVINKMVKKIGSRGKFGFTKIRIQVIDKRENWKRLCGYIIDIANAYFANMEIKLDSVVDFVSTSFEEFMERTKELDIFVIARFFAKDRVFNYSLIRIILNEMKEDAILFYFDSCNETFYANLKEISNTHYFSEVMNCQNLCASFENLGDEQYYFDLPMSWDTRIQPIMFSTWIKVAVQGNSFIEIVKPVAFNQLNLNKSEKESISEMSTLNKVASTSKSATHEQINTDIAKEKVKTSAKSDAYCGYANINSDKKQINDVTKQCNLDSPSEPANLVNGKKEIESSKKHFAQPNCQNGQANVNNGAKEVKTPTKYCSQFDSPSKKVNAVSVKKKVKSLTNLSNPGNSASKSTKDSDIQKTHEILDTLLSTQNKQTRTGKQSKKSQCLNVLGDAAISKTVTAKSENEVNCVKELGCKSSASYTTQVLNPDGKAKTTTSNISTSSSKIITANQGDQILISKQTENGDVTCSASKANESQIKKAAKSSKKSAKKDTSLKSLASKEEFETKPIKNKTPTTTSPEVETEKSFRFNLPKKSTKNTAKTKKSNTNNATENIKLTGKFARMDLEKKNKDERHKMRAKKASFSKHANFDYDD